MLTARMGGIDVRLFYYKKGPEEWSKCRWNAGDGMPHFWKYSSVSQN